MRLETFTIQAMRAVARRASSVAPSPFDQHREARIGTATGSVARFFAHVCCKLDPALPGLRLQFKRYGGASRLTTRARDLLSDNPKRQTNRSRADNQTNNHGNNHPAGN